MLFMSCAKNIPSTANPDNENLSILNSNKDDIDQQTAQSLPPDHCRIIGKVVSIKSPGSETKGNGPCQNHPCDVEVMVQKVLGYGSSFSEMLYPEDMVSIHFSPTTHNTKETFPNKNVIELPGLNVGDTFEANVQGSLMKNKKFKALTYTIVK